MGLPNLGFSLRKIDGMYQVIKAQGGCNYVWILLKDLEEFSKKGTTFLLRFFNAFLLFGDTHKDPSNS